jgi:hypothetical protein
MSAAAVLPRAVRDAAEAPVIDHENPWPGLVSFPEAAEAFFNGRDAERDDLLRLIRRETLTLLYGLSGLGKSSLLKAGLFPLLRQEHFLPVYVRLDHAETSPPHDAQLMHALLAECAERGVEAPAPRQGESVWELLHRADGGFWDAKNYPVTPVLVIDQFEEIFTLGRQSPARQDRSARFLAELGDLIDNRPPDALVHRLDADPDAAAGYAFAHPGCKIVVSMREDFLPELGALGEHTRSTFQNYLRLLRMRGDTATDAIVRTGGHLVDGSVARAIVCFLARIPPERQPSIDLTQVDVEPALLSLVCRELNQRRQKRALDRITADLLDVSRTEILETFYAESFGGMPAGMRVFVEEELLTETGYRDAAALDDALRLPGVTAERLDALVARRLIRKEERFGTPRIELTHDVLTDVVRESRDRRRAEEQAEEQAEERRREQEAAHRARRRRAAAGLVMVVAVSLSAFVWSAEQTRQATREERLLSAQRDTLRMERETTARLEGVLTSERVEQQRVADSLTSSLTLQNSHLEASRRALAAKEDSVREMLRTTSAALQRADVSERVALVGAETADFYREVTGHAVRRQIQQGVALDATARADLARADTLRREAAEALQRNAELQALHRAVTGVLCRAGKDDAAYAVRTAVEGALEGGTLCGAEGTQTRPTRRPAATLRQEP